MVTQFKKLAAFFDRRDKLHFLGLLGLMVIGSLLDVVGVGAVPAFVAALAIPERVLQYPAVASVLEGLGITTGRQLVIWGGLALIVVYVLKNVFLTLVAYMQVRTTEQYRVRLSDQMFYVYMKAPYEFHLGRNSAELLRNVNLETKEIVQSVLNPLLSAAMGMLMTMFIVGLLVITTPSIALVGIGIVGGGSWLFMRAIKDRLHRYGQEARQQRRLGIQAVNQGLGGLIDARIHGQEDYFVRVFYESVVRFAGADRLKQFVAKVSPSVLETIAVTGLLAIVLVMVLTGSETATLIPTLALFGAAIVRLRATISQIVTGMSQVRYGIAAVDPLFDDLILLQEEVHIRRESEAGSTHQLTPPMRVEHAIVLDHVEYTYPNVEAPAIHDINLVIEKGTSVAFVGETGSGKTTLINVLLGLLKPQQGHITVDGMDIHSNLPAWHAGIGYIPQTIFLLDDTIRRNIGFGLEDAVVDEDKLWTAIRAAQLEEFIESLEEGVDTVVGEHGVRISGGQRQRIGLARALYHNPEVLIMDEATSSLDNRTESLVIKALERLKHDRTFIIIAHRLSTVRECDRLYFMKDGRIEAEGTYKELSHMHQGFRQMAEIA